MIDFEKQLCDFLLLILMGDNDGSSAQNHQGFCRYDDGVGFTLPQLYRRHIGEDSAGYLAFRRNVFTSNLNARLAGFGATVDILVNERNVDRSVYKIKWLP